MSTRVLYDPKNNIGCLYESVSDTAFGPVIYDETDDTAQDILYAFLNDLRENGAADPSEMLFTLAERFHEWHKKHIGLDGEFRLTEEERDGLV